jgi:hypothetical protein
MSRTQSREDVEQYVVGARRPTAFERARAARDEDRVARARTHPVEFDESGFPLPQRDRSMVGRVRQLLRV